MHHVKKPLLFATLFVASTAVCCELSLQELKEYGFISNTPGRMETIAMQKGEQAVAILQEWNAVLLKKTHDALLNAAQLISIERFIKKIDAYRKNESEKTASNNDKQ